MYQASGFLKKHVPENRSGRPAKGRPLKVSFFFHEFVTFL